MRTYDAIIDFLRGGGLGLPRLFGRSTLALALSLCVFSSAIASMVFEQAPVSGNDAFSSISAAQSADDFILLENTPVSALAWWGSYSKDPVTMPLDAFRVRISADDGTGRPTTDAMAEFTLAPTRIATSLADVSGANVYLYELALPSPLILPGGSTLYLSVVNQFDIGDPDANWYWLLSDATGENFYRSANGDPWANDLTGNLAFQMSSNAGTPIPLPGSLLLLLTGVVAMNLAISRRRDRFVSHPVGWLGRESCDRRSIREPGYGS